MIPVKDSFRNQKIRGWIGLAIVAGILIYVLKDMKLSQIMFGVLGFAVAIGIIAVAFLASKALGRFWKRRFPPPALWQQPREVSALFERELFDVLQPRLLLLEQDERASLWQDRESGQFWSAFAWDFEFTENVIYTPIAKSSDWRGMNHPAGQLANGKRQ